MESTRRFHGSGFTNSQPIQRTDNIRNMMRRYMSINFRRPAAFMPEQSLNVSQIGSIFEQMRGKGVAQGMDADFPWDFCPVASLFENCLGRSARQWTAPVALENVEFGGCDFQIAFQFIPDGF